MFNVVNMTLIEQDKQTIRGICRKRGHKKDPSFVYGCFCQESSVEDMSYLGSLLILGFLSEKETLRSWFGEELLCDYDSIKCDPSGFVFRGLSTRQLPAWKHYGQQMIGLAIPERLKIFRENLT